MNFFINSFSAALKLLFSGDPVILSAAINSLTFSVIAVLAAFIPATCLAFLLPRRSNRLSARFSLGVLRSFMAFPTVVIGLITFTLFARQGPLGQFGLLYSGPVVIFGEFFLAFPILAMLIHSSLEQLNPHLRETALTLGASSWQCLIVEAREAQRGFVVAVLTAFGRCVTELGIATMVGGNIESKTQTLATAIADKTSQGMFEQSMALGVLLLALALGVTLVTSLMQESD